MTAERLRRTVADPGFELRAAATTELPAGVCGQVEGIALVYDVVDTFGTRFRRGCLDRTRSERLAKGKVKLFWDHGDAPLQDGMYDTDLHIGTVRSLEDRQLADGRWVAWMRADIFETEKGRACKEYLKAVLATGGDTGLSIGIRPTKPLLRAKVDGRDVDDFVECFLGEISVTAMSSVPGTEVTQVRAEQSADTVEEEPATAEVVVVEPAALEPVEAPAATDLAPEPLPADLNYDPLLRGIHAALGDSRFRAITRGILGDACTPDNAATPAASDAGTQDSQPVPSEGTRTDLVPHSERLAFARAALLELYR